MTDADRDLGQDLCRFVDAGPSPYHAVAEMARRLEAAGFSELDEREHWALAPGDRRFVVRDGGSVAAFVVGSAAPSDAGFRMVGAHTDSPTFAVRPLPDVRRGGFALVGVEPYGGVLAHTWFDRDLTVAGRLAVRTASGITTALVRLPGAPLRIPNLAIHLFRELREEGFKPDPQQHAVPVWGFDSTGALLDALAGHAGVDPGDVLGHDLVLADTQPAALGGADDAFVLAPRLDNLASCHAALHALTAAGPGRATAVLVANNHEEIGSASAEGAQGSFLEDVLRRVVSATEGDDGQRFAMACARSRLVSSDMAHAVHPNYSDRHEPGHTPRLGGGPVLKSNANQSYATDAVGTAHFRAACAEAGVAVQHFATRADLPCGSTIGPLTATRLGVATVDVGNPLLSMHSVREQAAAADIAPMAAALRAHLSADE
ncbi:MAG TPA: M18 family aminopeptidase [Egibacteraceae bacterium]|nr:M18 family aminopeptidase [Egibacteraceae bacterium]